MDYYEFKFCWIQEVALERKPEVLELNSLKDQIPNLTKNKLHKVNKLTEALSVLDELYGQPDEIQSEIKGQIIALHIKASKSPEKEIELFDSVQYISSHIKEVGGMNMLESDQEYVTLISKHLSAKQELSWIRTEDKSWNSFFSFLGKQAKMVRKIQVLHNISSGCSS